MLENLRYYKKIHKYAFSDYSAYVYIASRISVEVLKHIANYHLSTIFTNKLSELFTLDLVIFTRQMLSKSAPYVIPKCLSCVQDGLQFHMEGYAKIMLEQKVVDISNHSNALLINNTAKAICFPLNMTVELINFIGLGVNLYKVLNLATDMGMVFNLSSTLLACSGFFMVSAASNICLIKCAELQEDIKSECAKEESKHLSPESLNKRMLLNTQKYIIGFVPPVISVLAVSIANQIVWHWFRSSLHLANMGADEVKLFTTINNTARLFMEVTYNVTSWQKLLANYLARSGSLKEYADKYLQSGV